MVLEVSSKLALNAIDKGLGVSKIFLEEGFELWPHNRSGTLMTALVLGPSEADSAIKKGGSKQNTIHFCGA